MAQRSTACRLHVCCTGINLQTDTQESVSVYDNILFALQAALPPSRFNSSTPHTPTPTHPTHPHTHPPPTTHHTHNTHTHTHPTQTPPPHTPHTHTHTHT